MSDMAILQQETLLVTAVTVCRDSRASTAAVLRTPPVRALVIELQQPQGPGEDAHIVGGIPCSSQPEALLRCQVEVHGPVPSDRGGRLDRTQKADRVPKILGSDKRIGF